MEPPLRVNDPSFADVRIGWAIAAVEHAAGEANRRHAEGWAALAATLREVRQFPAVYLGVHTAGHGADAVEFAVRAAVADIAVRVGEAESTVRTRAHHAELLMERAPRVWEAFRFGDIAPSNATTIAQLVTDLPAEVWAEFDERILDLAGLAPARFRPRAHALREELQTRPLEERAREARETRAVWVEAGRDGMCWLTAHLPADTAARVMARLDAATDHLAADDEPRTRDQLRADVFSDLLTGDGTPDAVRATVAVTVPVMTLLGAGQPGILEGVGPIDADTARHLAASAPSLQRILTDPITGTLLDVDRTSYRVPADLKRWLALRDGGCRFPGCGRQARNCDLDHSIGWVEGGTTSASNLMHLCRHHHRLKGESKWHLDHDPDGTATWTTPTGHPITTSPPPPF